MNLDCKVVRQQAINCVHIYIEIQAMCKCNVDLTCTCITAAQPPQGQLITSIFLLMHQSKFGAGANDVCITIFG